MVMPHKRQEMMPTLSDWRSCSGRGGDGPPGSTYPHATVRKMMLPWRFMANMNSMSRQGISPKLPVPPPHVVVRQERQADDQEKVSHGQVEQENPAGFPGLEVEAENPQGKAIAGSEHELQPHDRRQHFGNEVITEHTAVLFAYFQKMILQLGRVHE